MENKNVLSEEFSLDPANVDWELLASAWETSGLTRKAFCEQHRINYPRFIYQRSKLNAKRKSKPSSWLAVKQMSPKSSLISATTPAALSPGFLLRSLQGNQLSIPLDADTPTLKILLDFMSKN